MSQPPDGWAERHRERHPVWQDSSFAALLRRHPALAALRQYLPTDTAPFSFEGQREIEALQSSYADRGYGALFYALIRVLKPRRCVEIGIFQGFSLLTAASALRDNGAGSIAAYDLFDDYPYRHAHRPQVSQQILSLGLEGWATVHRADVSEVHEQWDGVDYLHIDVSNNGDTYRRVFEQWAHKVSQVILLEGGSAERDNVAWMHQYAKPAIAPALDDIARACPGWSFSVLQPFPSLTLALNRAALPDHGAP